MSNKQIKLIIDLAKKQLQRGITKEEALRFFIRIGVRTPTGRFTKSYRNLGRAIKEKKSSSVR